MVSKILMHCNISCAKRQNRSISWQGCEIFNKYSRTVFHSLSPFQVLFIATLSYSSKHRLFNIASSMDPLATLGMTLLRAKRYNVSICFPMLFFSFILTKEILLPLFRLHIVTAGNGNWRIRAFVAFTVTMIGVLDHRIYTLDIK